MPEKTSIPPKTPVGRLSESSPAVGRLSESSPTKENSQVNSRLGESCNSTASSHRTWLFLSLAVVVLALVLNSNGPRQVVMPVVNLPLPEVCSARRMFNRDCPGCGLTRCFINMAHGVAGGVGAGAQGICGRRHSAQVLLSQSGRQFARAWRFNPVGTFLFVVVAAQIPFRGWQLYRLQRGQPQVRIPRRVSYWWLVAFAFALFLQWSVKMIAQALG